MRLPDALEHDLQDLERLLGTTAPQAGPPRLRSLRAEITIVWRALEESIRLQSHYAALLNMHDGGKRTPFADAAAWIARLKAMGDV
jgi:hypothetical protein